MNYRHIEELISPYRGGRLFAGFSGGADSTALLLAAGKVCSRLDIPLAAVHFEHGLRGQASLDDAVFCRNFCETRGIRFLMIPLRVNERRLPGESDETAARRCRLKAWRELAGGKKQTAVLLGHHGDDVRENFFLRLARGANSSGLTGLKAVSVVDGVTFIRPMLVCRRHNIEEFLRRENVTGWCEDCTNQDEKYRRNFIRRRLLPLFVRHLPFADKGIDRAIEALTQDAAYLDEMADAESAGLSGRECMSRDEWQSIAPALLPRVLRRVISRRLGREWIPPHNFTVRFREMLAGGKGRLEVSGGRELVFSRENISWSSPETAETAVLQWCWRDTPVISCGKWIFKASQVSFAPEKAAPGEAYFSAASMPDILEISPALPGERMVPFGRKTPVKLKKLRIDRGIAPHEVPPAVRASGGEVIWYPLVRHSGFFRTETGKEAVKLEIVENTPLT